MSNELRNKLIIYLQAAAAELAMAMTKADRLRDQERIHEIRTILLQLMQRLKSEQALDRNK